jgi:predicted ester cyclase
MTPETVVRRFLEEVINGGNVNLVDSFWAPDLIWYGGSMGELHGIEAYQQMLVAATKSAFTGMHLTIHDVIASGEKVVVRFTNSGTQAGPFQGIPATGKDAEWHGIGIYTVRNNLITEAWFCEDTLGMLFQLGASIKFDG